jgi:hypothetical protein
LSGSFEIVNVATPFFTSIFFAKNALSTKLFLTSEFADQTDVDLSIKFSDATDGIHPSISSIAKSCVDSTAISHHPPPYAHSSRTFNSKRAGSVVRL